MNGLVGFFLAAATAVSWQPSRVAEAPGLANPILIDGETHDWELSLGNAGAPAELGRRRENPSDAQAMIFFRHDTRHLYILGIVWDDDIQARHRGGEIWRGDLLEFRTEDLGFGLSPSGDPHVFWNPEKKDVAIRAEAKSYNEGFVVEARVSLRSLGKAPEIPINIALKDVDPKGNAVAHVWSGYQLKSRPSFGRLLLKSPPPRAKPKPLSCGQKGRTAQVSRPIRAKGAELFADERPVVLRAVNFQLADASWTRFWTEWNEQKVVDGLSAARSLGANAVRIFLFYELFGGTKPSKIMMERLSRFVALAREQEMLVIPSFFSFKKEFRKQWWAPMATHAQNIVSAFVGEPAIAMWDLMNEPDHAWKAGATTQEDVYRWSLFMLKKVKQADPSHMVTLGLAGHFARESNRPDAQMWSPEMDVISLHWYFPEAELESALRRVRAWSGKPIVLQEIGQTDLVFSAEQTAEFYRRVCDISASQKLSGIAAWELYDHPIGSIGWFKPRYREGIENGFGLLERSGRAKPAAGVFCSCLQPTRFRMAP